MMGDLKTKQMFPKKTNLETETFYEETVLEGKLKVSQTQGGYAVTNGLSLRLDGLTSGQQTGSWHLGLNILGLHWLPWSTRKKRSPWE